jgi:hypothetical protein
MGTGWKAEPWPPRQLLTLPAARGLAAARNDACVPRLGTDTSACLGPHHTSPANGRRRHFVWTRHVRCWRRLPAPPTSKTGKCRPQKSTRNFAGREALAQPDGACYGGCMSAERAARTCGAYRPDLRRPPPQRPLRARSPRMAGTRATRHMLHVTECGGSCVMVVRLARGRTSLWRRCPGPGCRPRGATERTGMAAPLGRPCGCSRQSEGPCGSA